MKRKKKAPSNRSSTPKFQRLPSANWDIQRHVAHEGAADALVRAVNRARELGFASIFDNLDKVLGLAEPWVDRDVLRAHILRDGDPAPGTKFVIAFVRSDGAAIEGSRWYLLPPANSGATKLRIVAIGLDEEHYGVLVRDGWEAFFSKVLSRLRDIGQEPRD